MNNKAKRIFLDSILFLSIFFLPWWITLIIGGALVYFFDSFFEILIVGLVLDTLYGIGNQGVLLGLPLTLSLSIFFLVSFLVKEHFVFNQS